MSPEIIQWYDAMIFADSEGGYNDHPSMRIDMINERKDNDPQWDELWSPGG